MIIEKENGLQRERRRIVTGNTTTNTNTDIIKFTNIKTNRDRDRI